MNTYSVAVSGVTKNIVFSTSVTRDIDETAFNKSCKEGNQTRFIRFRGKEVRHITHYIPTHLNEEHPHRVIILCGGNDLPDRHVENSPVTRIADDIIEAGRVCMQHGVKTVAISSIPPRNSFHFQLYRKELNDLLKVKCDNNGMQFIDNKTIILKYHVLHDGVHMNANGSEILRDNFLSFINNNGQQQQMQQQQQTLSHPDTTLQPPTTLTVEQENKTHIVG